MGVLADDRVLVRADDRVDERTGQAAGRGVDGDVDGAVDGDAEQAMVLTARAARTPRRSAKVQNWSRLVHVYLSMACFAIVLFFSFTGLTLNHPEWTFGLPGSTSQQTGTLPATWRVGGQTDWLVVADTLRDAYDLRGAVSDRNDQGGQSTISFKGPGFGADAQIDDATGTYQITVERQGLLGILNDLHKGRDTAASWNWLIDVVAVLLILISLSGLLLQLYLRRRRRSALWSVAAGALVLLAFVWWAMR